MHKNRSLKIKYENIRMNKSIENYHILTMKIGQRMVVSNGTVELINKGSILRGLGDWRTRDVFAFLRSGARCDKSGLKGTLSERRRSSSSLLSLGIIDFPAHESNFLEEATVARFASAYYHVKSINSRSLTLLRSALSTRTDDARSFSFATFREREKFAKNSPLGKFRGKNVACCVGISDGCSRAKSYILGEINFIAQ